MSGEFGDYLGGYFHDKIRNAVEDTRNSKNPLTQLWGEFLEEFQEIARSISYCEACDSGPDDPIFETMQRLPELKRRLDKIQNYIEPYHRVAQEAVRIHSEKKKK